MSADALRMQLQQAPSRSQCNATYLKSTYEYKYSNDSTESPEAMFGTFRALDAWVCGFHTRHSLIASWDWQ